MIEPHVLYHVDGPMAMITLNRLEVKNTFSDEMITLWRKFLEKAGLDARAYFLPRLVGPGKALELSLTGDVLTPEEALEIGLVNRVVPHDRLMEETKTLAEKIANKPPLAVRMMKRAVYQAQSSALRSHLDYISSQLALLPETQDFQEAA